MNIFSAWTQQYIWSFVDLLRQLLKIIPIDWSMIHLFEEILKVSSFCWVLSWVYWVLSDAFLGYSIRTFEIYTLYIMQARGRKNESLWCILVKEGWYFGRLLADFLPPKGNFGRHRGEKLIILQRFLFLLYICTVIWKEGF